MTSPATTHELVGTDLAGGRYTLREHIAEGGMADVFRARHNILRKEIAIKILKPEFAADEIIRERFAREARALSTVTHDNVVDISDFGTTPTGSVFFAMELLSGEPLSDTLADSGPLPWPRVKIIGLQICRALHAAHMRGVIHRDMKPENCWRMKRGANSDFIKVLDFGIAKICPTDGASLEKLTETGQVFGTAEYMSPEQAQGRRADERSDVYSVGIILYQMVTGRLPFTGDSTISILNKQVYEEPVPPRTADCPAQLESVILRSLAKDPDDRFWSIKDLAEALAAVGVKQPIAESSSGSLPSQNRDDALTSDLRQVNQLLRSVILLVMAVGIMVGIMCVVLVVTLLVGK
jgi:serine/threonine protein kinase